MVILNEAIPPNRGPSKDKVAASSAFHAYLGHECCFSLGDVLTILIPNRLVMSEVAVHVIHLCG